MFAFGSGVLQGFRTDIAVGTPVNFGLVQDVTLDASFDLKELYGQFQWPVALARGKGKWTGKAKLARISETVFGDFFFGTTPVAGQVATAVGEGPSLIPATPFTVTVSNSAQFVDDLGVINSVTGIPFTKIATAGTPTAGQYKVTAGVYTFSSADNVSAISVLISYTYSITATGGKIVVTNKLLGDTPTFQANLFTTFQGKAITVKLPNCVSNKLAFNTKLDDFTLPEIDFSIFADASGNVATWSFTEVA